MAEERQDAEIHVPGGYVFEATLGRGGMGAVYRVREAHSGDTLALKRLLLPAGADDEVERARARQLTDLFEREFHTLADLRHPRVIEVYDFGVDEHGPYYTMELLGGADVRHLAPLDWREACAVVRDAASSLAILHSRRLVHRDVSPGNVRRTAEGHAKLLDFGAMTPFGVTRDVVGTPPCTAPEALRMEPLDPRTDLFALGATLYFALTRRWPFRAARHADLAAAWCTPPTPPSEIAAEVPPALDALVLALLSIDPRGRPESAAVVIDRLEGIADLEPGDALGVAEAYLTTPTLVGRDAMLELFRSTLARARARRGGVLMLDGERGLGRSRLLHAFALEAKLSGAIVLAASASAALDGPFGVARAWIEQLLRSRLDVARLEARPYAATLGHLSPELHAHLGRPELATFETAHERSLRIQADLRSWIERIVRRHRSCVLVDDLDRIDAETAGVVAGLTESAPASRLVLVVSGGPTPTATEGAAARHPSPVERVVREAATVMRISPLSETQTETLLRSVFGDVPRVELLSSFMYRQTDGSPALCMELASFLLLRGELRFEGGTWSLPENPAKLDVPAAHEERVAERLRALCPDARMLAECRALCLDTTTMGVRDLANTLDGDDRARRARAAIAELMARGLFVPASGSARYDFAQPATVGVIKAGLDGNARRDRHARLARACEARDDAPLTTAHHLHGAGDLGRALDLLIESEITAAEVLANESAATVPVIEALLAEARRQGRPPRDEMKLLTLLIECVATVDGDFSEHTAELSRHLRRDSGLDIWERLDPGMEPLERSRAALAQAQRTYDATCESERGIPPAAAIERISQSLGAMMIFAARARDTRAIADAVRLMTPLAPLSPLAAFHLEGIGTALRFTSGRDIGDRYRQVSQRARDDAIPGLNPSSRTQIHLLAGFYDAWMNSEFDRDADWLHEIADALVANPIYRVQGWQLRLCFHAARGHALEMATCRRSRDLALAESPITHQHASSGLMFDLRIATTLRDVLALKRVCEAIDAEAARYPGWRATALHARAEYHLARGELDRARVLCDEAIAAAPPGEVGQWAHVVPTWIGVMILQGEVREACTRAREALQIAHEQEIARRTTLGIELALGLAEVASGAHTEGFERIAGVRHELASRGYAGDDVTRVELQAALAAGDAERFDRALGELRDLYAPGQHPALLAVYEQFAEQGRRRFELAASGDRVDPARERARQLVRERVRSIDDAGERVRRVLALLVEQSCARAGYLFLLRDRALAPRFAESAQSAPAALARAVHAYFAQESEFITQMTATALSGVTPQRTEWLIDGRIHAPTMLGCHVEGEACLAGVAVLEYDAHADEDPPAALLVAIAEHLAAAGDTEPVPLLDL